MGEVDETQRRAHRHHAHREPAAPRQACRTHVRERGRQEGRRAVAGRASPGGSARCRRSPEKRAAQGMAAAQADIQNFKDALAPLRVEEAFMTAASPGLVSMFLGNTYYKTEEEFLWAVANAMKPEYEAIVRAGFLLQLDCPDLAMTRHREFADRPVGDFREYVRLHIEVLNAATRDIAPDRLRVHLCWGNYPGPHHRDVPL